MSEKVNSINNLVEIKMVTDIEEVPWDAVSYVKASWKREAVFKELARQPQMASDIVDNLDLSRQEVSVFISHLKEDTEMGGSQYDLVQCLTPDKVNYRIYGLTEIGEKVAEQVLDGPNGD